MMIMTKLIKIVMMVIVMIIVMIVMTWFVMTIDMDDDYRSSSDYSKYIVPTL